MGVSCNRVPVIDGHTETLYAEFAEERRPAGGRKGARVIPRRAAEAEAPDRARAADNREDGERQAAAEAGQDGRDRAGHGVTVGRVRNGIDERSLQLTLLSHNTIRGAAGTAILTAELMEREGYIG